MFITLHNIVRIHAKRGDFLKHCKIYAHSGQLCVLNIFCQMIYVQIVVLNEIIFYNMSRIKKKKKIK